MNQVLKKNKKYPLVTIITPTYNRASFLEETIQSVLKQDYPNIEYIVLDDGSTDRTTGVVKKFGDKLIYEHHKNIGEVRTVNKGFMLAKGEIIGVVNSDDPLLPGAISEIVKFMINNPEIIVVYSDWIYIDENGREIRKFFTSDYDYEHMIRTHNCPLGASAFFRKKILKILKGRDERFRYVSDYDFWLRAGLIGKFARIPKILATSRVHPGQATLKGRSFRAAMDHIRVIEKIFSDPKLPPYIKKIKSEAYEKACEAARICRGNRFSTKILISLVCLYYSPFPYLKTFIRFRLQRLNKLFPYR